MKITHQTLEFQTKGEFDFIDFTAEVEKFVEATQIKNGHSHCEALHLPPNLVLNIIDGKVQLGQWQRVFLIELDKSKARKVQIQAMGE